MKRALLVLPVILSVLSCARNNPSPGSPLPSTEYTVSTYAVYPDAAGRPQGVALDTSGNVFVCGIDGGIWKIANNGTGSLVTQLSDQLLDLACDRRGNFFVAARDAKAIFKVTAAGASTTLAGGLTDVVSFDIDSSGNLYLGNDSVICRLDQTGKLTVVYKLPSANSITAVAVDRSHTLYYATAYQLWRLDSLGNNSLIAGRPVAGDDDGIGSAAGFLGVFELRVDRNGILWAADSYSIRRITPDGTVTTIAGGTSPGDVDGDGDKARFHYLVGMALETDGTIFVADVANNKIRKVVHK